jgi:hypothetical protein
LPNLRSVEELDQVSLAEIDLLRNEFSKPIDVRDFIGSVPQGMQAQVSAEMWPDPIVLN